MNLEKVLVTGAGFVGTSLCKRLLQGEYDVTLLSPNVERVSRLEDLRGVNFVKGSVLDMSQMGELVKKNDAVVNLSGYIDKEGKDPLRSLEINVGGELAILEAIRLHNPEAYHVYMGTRAQFGKVNTSEPVRESQPQVPNTIYGLHKKMGEDSLVLYRDLHGLNTLGLRLIGIYGPSLDGSNRHFLGSVMQRALRNEPISVRGDGSAVQDFIFIDDIVSLMEKSIEGKVKGIFNVGCGRGDSVKAYIQYIIKKTGSKSSLSCVPMSKEEEFRDLDGSVIDISAVSKATGWSPENDVYSGIDKTLKWMRERDKTLKQEIS